MDLSGWKSARSRCTTRVNTDASYRAFSKFSGVSFGPDFRRLTEIFKGDAEAVATILPPQDSLRIAHPIILDACVQLVAILMGLHSEACVPTQVDFFTIMKALPSSSLIYAHSRASRITPYSYTGDVDLYSSDGELIAAMRGMTLTALKSKASQELSLLYPKYVALEGSSNALELLHCSRFLAISHENVPVPQALEGARVVNDISSLEKHLADFAFDLIIDCRGSVVASSALLAVIREINEPPSILFVVKPGSEFWGFVRSARKEFPSLRLYCTEESSLLTMLSQLKAADWRSEEMEMVGSGLVPRLEISPISDFPTLPVSAATSHYLLEVMRPGQLQSLTFVSMDTEKDGVDPSEIRIDVKAVSLHFKDVMLSMNMIPDLKPVLGSECTGFVTHVGSGAVQSGLKIGDRVIAVRLTASPSIDLRHTLMGTSVVAPHDFVLKAPESIDLVPLAGFTMVMATAYYALLKKAKIGKGSRVLIHSAMGGVGQAAM